MNLAQHVHRIINENPELLPYKRQLVGCCRHRVPDDTIRRRVKDFLANYPQFKNLLGFVLNGTPSL